MKLFLIDIFLILYLCSSLSFDFGESGQMKRPKQYTCQYCLRKCKIDIYQHMNLDVLQKIFLYLKVPSKKRKTSHIYMCMWIFKKKIRVFRHILKHHPNVTN